MPRDARAYLTGIIEPCDAITAAVRGLDLAGYESNRLVRSSVDREFIIIGEAVAALGRIASKAFGAITRARRIVDFYRLQRQPWWLSWLLTPIMGWVFPGDTRRRLVALRAAVEQHGLLGGAGAPANRMQA